MKLEKNEKWLILSCGMLADELQEACRICNCDIPIIWMKRALHNRPQYLKDGIQKVIDEHQEYDQILLTYGLCGNGILGIKSEHTGLVIPKFHDCIHQLLQNVDKGTGNGNELWKNNSSTGHIYLTRSWTLDEESIYHQSQRILKQYGREQGNEILKQIYGSYTDIDIIDTDCYDVNPILEYAQKAASLNQMKVNTVDGSTVILQRLLKGEWDENFIVLEPGEVLKRSHFFES